MSDQTDVQLKVKFTLHVQFTKSGALKMPPFGDHFDKIEETEFRTPCQSEHSSRKCQNLKLLGARARLGQTKGGIAAPFPPKPKRMRWHTYLRMRRKAQQVEVGIAALLSSMTERNRIKRQVAS